MADYIPIQYQTESTCRNGWIEMLLLMTGLHASNTLCRYLKGSQQMKLANVKRSSLQGEGCGSM